MGSWLRSALLASEGRGGSLASLRVGVGSWCLGRDGQQEAFVGVRSVYLERTRHFPVTHGVPNLQLR